MRGLGWICLVLCVSCVSRDIPLPQDDFYVEQEYDAALQVSEASSGASTVASPGQSPVSTSDSAEKNKNNAQLKPARRKAKRSAELKAAASPGQLSTSPHTDASTAKGTKSDAVQDTPSKPKNLLPMIVTASGRKLPEMEDATGFVGRRPVEDPFRVGEEVAMEVTYFGVKAGELRLKVLDFKTVNARKAYHFRSEVRSNSSFSMIYKVDDWSETFVDFESLLPFNYSVHVDHSNEKKQIQGLFDHGTLQVKLWEKKIDSRGEMQKRSSQWEMLAFSQNVISVFFYIRNFQLQVGKKILFPLTDQNNNMILEAEVLRKEKIEIPGQGEVEFQWAGRRP